jgi:predicted small secreted protein
MKIFFVLMVLFSFSALTACNAKGVAKDVGDAGNGLAKTVDDTINRENVKKDNE